MKSRLEDARAGCFRAHYHLWIALSHFLPAGLVGELAAALIAESSQGRLCFDDLCEAHVSHGESSLASWSVDFKPGKQGLDHFLQRVVRALAWQSDISVAFDDQELAPEDREVMRSLESALSLARIDLWTIEEWVGQQTEPPSGLRVMVSGMLALKAAGAEIGDVVIQQIERMCDGLEPMLRVILIKHLGDLCADVDAPPAALRLYDMASSVCASIDRSIWEDFPRVFTAMILQSTAAMLRLTNGPVIAAEMLSNGFDQMPFKDVPLLRTNGAPDAMNFHSLGGEGLELPRDIRPALLITPQQISSHELGRAFEYWDSKHYQEAHRCFWASLRRQIAVGSSGAAAETKAYYGRSIVDELERVIGSQRRPESFALALRLLIESERPDIIEQHEWSEAFLQVYLTTDALKGAVDHADRSSGARDGRRLALVALARGWLLKVSPEATEIVCDLFVLLSSSAKDWSWLPKIGRQVPRAALKAFEQVAYKRPELRRLGSSAFTVAMLSSLSAKDFHASWAALDAAVAFEEGLDKKDLRSCVTGALGVLEGIDPSRGSWPLLRPAISLISSSNVQRLWTQDEDLGRSCATMILRFGLQSQYEGTRLLFLLRGLGPYVDQSSAEATALFDVVRAVRRQAQAINSTAVTTAISALLAAPAAAGLEGVQDAISGLIAVLKSAQTEHPSIGLGSAYEPIIQLYQRKSGIADDLGLSTEQVAELMKPVIAPLAEFWRIAVLRPLVFTTFSIPKPTAPNPTLIHNWAYATLGFARATDAADSLATELRHASENPLLRPSIELARAVRLTAYELQHLDAAYVLNVAAIKEESRAGFYAALGQRLAVLSSGSLPDRSLILDCLLEQCFRHGPHGLDAGVLALAIEAGVKANVDSPIRDSYVAQLRRDRNLNLGLMPLLRAVSLDWNG